MKDQIASVLDGRASFAVLCAHVEDIEPLLPDGCAHLMPTDGPYCGVVGDSWDNAWRDEASFLDWKVARYRAWRRILAPRGTLYDFASPTLAARVEVACRENFAVFNHIVWDKPGSVAAARYGTEHLRGFVEKSERIIVADDGGREATEYLRAECARLDISPEELSGLLGFKATAGSVAPRRYLSVNGFAPIDRAKYSVLQTTTGGFGRSWESLYRPFAVGLADELTDVWRFDPVPPYEGKHACEKPRSMAGHIIGASSRPGDLVLVFFSGSGVFAAEALAQGRRVIAVEADPYWAERTRAACAIAAETGIADIKRAARTTPRASKLGDDRQLGLNLGAAP